MSCITRPPHRESLPVMLTTVSSSRGSDVDPAGYAFDPEPARRIVGQHVHATVARRGADWRDVPQNVRAALVERIDRELVGEYGAHATRTAAFQDPPQQWRREPVRRDGRQRLRRSPRPRPCDHPRRPHAA